MKWAAACHIPSMTQIAAAAAAAAQGLQLEMRTKKDKGQRQEEVISAQSWESRSVSAFYSSPSAPAELLKNLTVDYCNTFKWKIIMQNNCCRPHQTSKPFSTRLICLISHFLSHLSDIRIFFAISNSGGVCSEESKDSRWVSLSCVRFFRHTVA